LTASVPLVAAIENPPRDTRDLSGRHPLAGAQVANLSPAVAEELGLEEQGSGVVVLDVAPNTPAARFRFKRGDIVVGLNDVRITSVEVLVTALGREPSGWRLSFRREGQVYNVAIQG